MVSGNSELSQRNIVTMSAEGHSPNDTGQCKVRNTDPASPSSVERMRVIESGLEHTMSGRINSLVLRAVGSAELCIQTGFVPHSKHTASLL